MRFIVLFALLAQIIPNLSFAQASPPRNVTPDDIKIVDEMLGGRIKTQLARLGIGVEENDRCLIFLLTSSLKNGPQQIPIAQHRMSLPYITFALWDQARPFSDSVLYHLFPDHDEEYQRGHNYPRGNPDRRNAIALQLADFNRYPPHTWVANNRHILANRPDTAPDKKMFTHLGVMYYQVKPFFFPGRGWPQFEKTALETTCFKDINRFRECPCVGSFNAVLKRNPLSVLDYKR